MDKASCIYLRKSRESGETDDTLGKHRATLHDLAKEKGITVSKIYEEIVSGESIAKRPQMIELLSNVEDGMWHSVLCMDIDRLGRGGLRNQGQIVDTFKDSGTLIVTPRKIYDLRDENDADVVDMMAFISRKEYQMITRRMLSGRVRSIKSGHYITPTPPYGYNRSGTRGLAINETEAEVVRLIYEMYVSSSGCYKIARHLSDMGIPSRSHGPWIHSTINGVLSNPVYCGKVRWFSETKAKDTIIADGNHKSIISPELWQRAQNVRKNKEHSPTRTKISNPLAGLVVCGVCGRTMVQNQKGADATRLVCLGYGCKNISSRLDHVESVIISELEITFGDLVIKPDLPMENKSRSKDKLKLLMNRKAELQKQKNHIFDSYEAGVYSVETYLKRSAQKDAEIDANKAEVERTEKELVAEAGGKDIKEKIRKVLEYYLNFDASERNRLLKTIIDNVTYFKDKKGLRISVTVRFKPV